MFDGLISLVDLQMPTKMTLLGTSVIEQWQLSEIGKV